MGLHDTIPDALNKARHKAHGHPKGHDVSNTPTPNVPKRNKSIRAARGAVDRQIDRARAKIGAEKHRRTVKRAKFKTPIERKAAARSSSSTTTRKKRRIRIP